MPPAAAQMAIQQQLQGALDLQQEQPWPKYGHPIFNDTPTHDGLIKIQNVLAWLHSNPRGGSSLGAYAEQADPGSGGGSPW